MKPTKEEYNKCLDQMNSLNILKSDEDKIYGFSDEFSMIAYGVTYKESIIRMAEVVEPTILNMLIIAEAIKEFIGPLSQDELALMSYIGAKYMEMDMVKRGYV